MPTNLNQGEKKKKNTEEKETSQKWRQAVAIRESDKYKCQRSNIHIRWNSVSLKVVNKAILEGGTIWKTTGLAFLKTTLWEKDGLLF